MTDLNWPPGRRRRARPAKTPLTRTEIVRTALRLVQTEGIDAVSMRRLATEFDTGPASFYAHVASKDELLQLMFDEMCGLVEIPELDPPRWKEQVKELARAGHAAMIAHNDLARAALATIPTGPNALLITEAMLGMMLAGGIPSRIASWAMDRIFLYITADAYEYSIWRRQVREAGSDKQTYIGQLGEQAKAYFEELPADRYPNVRKYADDLMGGGPEARFDLGLELLVDGLDRYATPRPPDR
ncbi:TetR/AcrR family transcriptional regulator C-terminal domain-containing protein [Actinoplanes sp. LDG1-06]|uniref:TetR/AcrR family transcriptional regulator C-terminal domain-containing protein n=1 Tax=Paractinoplanes ovalisporus TaxID=2810368 RepID=A0ABS2AFC2_9ACTN|nr:TetR/AcrR family transcriptional regulator [Actinoplanes ovalisporus]MBM2618098.1 TetR/AcrR family transcriptional regulator C-terminal domain-containing protein [Actinoplanes ovalisporus]